MFASFCIKTEICKREQTTAMVARWNAGGQINWVQQEGTGVFELNSRTESSEMCKRLPKSMSFSYLMLAAMDMANGQHSTDIHVASRDGVDANSMVVLLDCLRHDSVFCTEFLHAHPGRDRHIEQESTLSTCPKKMEE